MKKLPNYVPLIAALVIIVLFYFSLKPSNKEFEAQLNTLSLTMLSGKSLELKEFQGNFYILHLFASWCQNCKDDFKLLQEIKDQTNIPIIGISVNDNVGKLKIMNKAKWPYDFITLDLDAKIIKLLKNKAIPETILVTPEGKVALRHLGSLDKLFVTKQIIPTITATYLDNVLDQ